jgi:hypothetical protein
MRPVIGILLVMVPGAVVLKRSSLLSAVTAKMVSADGGGVGGGGGGGGATTTAKPRMATLPSPIGPTGDGPVVRLTRTSRVEPPVVTAA